MLLNQLVALVREEVLHGLFGSHVFRVLLTSLLTVTYG